MEPGREKHRLLLESLPDAFAYHQIITDSSGNPVDYLYLDVNPAFYKMTGLSREEFMGKRASEVYPDIKESSLDWIATYGRVALTGESTRFEHYFEPPGRWYDITAYSNEPGYFGAVFRDITLQKKSKMEQEILLDNIETQIWYLNDIETYGLVNQAHADFFGVKKEELENKNLYELMASREEAETCIGGNQEVFRRKQKVQSEELILNGRGEKRLLSITRTPKLDSSNNVEYVVCSAEDITERKQAEKKLNYQFEFDKIIAEISSTFLTLSSEEIDEGINYALKLTGELCNIDRSYVFQFSADRQTMINTHEWCSQGVEPLMNSQNLPIHNFPWWLEKLERFETTAFGSTAGLPPEFALEKNILQAQSIQSVLGIPLVWGNELRGFMGFDSVSEEKTWTSEELSMLKVVAEIISKNLIQNLTDKAFRYERSQFLSIFDSINEVIYVSDPQTYEILYVNQYMKRLFSKDLIGGICYRELQNKEAPCDFCTNSIIMQNKGEPYQWEYHNSQLYRDFLITDKIITWPDGRDVRFELAVDITKRKQAEEALNYRYQFEQLVSEISSSFLFLPSEKIDEGINYALILTGEFFNVNRSYVFQYSPDGQYMSNTHEWCVEGTEPQMDKIQNLPVISFPWWTEQIQYCDYVHIPDINNLPPEADAERKEFQRQGIQSLLCVPLRSKDRFIGFFGFDSVKTEKKWTKETISFLRIIADILVNAFEKNKTEEKIRYLSFYDSLTGLHSRIYLEEEMKRLDTERQLPISIIMADLNSLKLVNDTYGHSTGDKMLKSAADIIKESCREEDIIARWGGDEFVVLLPRTTIEEANIICKRIHEKCSRTRVEDVPVSIAAGAASKYNIEEDLADTLQDAEDYMYKHKLMERHNVRSAVVNSLLKKLGEKSYETEAHTLHMQTFAFKIGGKIKLSDSELDRLGLLITLHDIGKINIPEEILTKKEALTREDWEVMKKHPEIGSRIARATVEFGHVAQDILAHHERWDGTGYPRGLKGAKIPLLARITAIADAYEVMTSGRPYKKAMTREEIVAELKRCAGTQFDPELVEVFLSVLETENN